MAWVESRAHSGMVVGSSRLGTQLTDTLFYFSATAHWDEKFHHKMVDNRGFMVTRSYTVGVTMMHRTGSRLTRQRVSGCPDLPFPPQ